MHTQKCEIFIALSWPEWFRERASVFRHTYVASFFRKKVVFWDSWEYLG